MRAEGETRWWLRVQVAESCAVAATFQHISTWALLYIYDLTRLEATMRLSRTRMHICSIGIPTAISYNRVRIKR